MSLLLLTAVYTRQQASESCAADTAVRLKSPAVESPSLADSPLDRSNRSVGSIKLGQGCSRQLFLMI